MVNLSVLYSVTNTQAAAEDNYEATEEVPLVRKRPRMPSKETENTSSHAHVSQGSVPVEPPKSKSLKPLSAASSFCAFVVSHHINSKYFFRENQV